MNENILKVDGLVKHYQQFSLQKISFELPRGYIMGFMGENGAGKSTTIKCIMDLLQYESGKIEIFGENHRSKIELRNKIGYVSEEQNFYEEMSVAWTGKFVSKFYRAWNDDYFQELLLKFGINPAKQIKELSKGMKLKLALALALTHQPELLILDEPTAGLDPIIRDELLRILREFIQDQQRAVFFSSHITSDIEKLADYVIILHQGKIVLNQEKDQLLEEWKLFKGENELLEPELVGMLTGVRQGEFGFSAATKRVEEVQQYLKQKNLNAKWQLEKITLDELLLRLIEEEKRCLI